MNSKLLHEYAWPDAEGLAKLKERMTRLNMSARAFDRILRVARTIADLEYSASLAPAASSASASASSGAASVSALAAAVTAPVLSRHIAEAIGYRSLDRASYGKTF